MLQATPPGEYGLKAGNDAFDDEERAPQVIPDHDPIYNAPADSWKRAATVRVEADYAASNCDLEEPRGS